MKINMKITKRCVVCTVGEALEEKIIIILLLVCCLVVIGTHPYTYIVVGTAWSQPSVVSLVLKRYRGL